MKREIRNLIGLAMVIAMAWCVQSKVASAGGARDGQAGVSLYAIDTADSCDNRPPPPPPPPPAVAAVRG